MTINFQEKYNRYRVYISLGHRDSIQRTFHVETYGGKRKALNAAKKEHARLIDIHRTQQLEDHPFILPLKHREGTTRVSPIEIRNITITLDSKYANEPDWSIRQKSQQFHTYPPNILIQFFKYKNGKRITGIGTYKRFKLTSSHVWDMVYRETIDHYITLKPQYAKYRQEMLDKKPSWEKKVWPFILNKTKSYYGEDFYLDCGGKK